MKQKAKNYYVHSLVLFRRFLARSLFIKWSLLSLSSNSLKTMMGKIWSFLHCSKSTRLSGSLLTLA